MKKLDDELELLMGERIGKVLDECGSRRRRSERTEEEILSQFEESDREKVDRLLEEFISSNYEDCRLSYCAGLEDGIRLARKILSV